jgi:hypothetical protein
VLCFDPRTETIVRLMFSWLSGLGFIITAVCVFLPLIHIRFSPESSSWTSPLIRSPPFDQGLQVKLSTWGSATVVIGTIDNSSAAINNLIVHSAKFITKVSDFLRFKR